MLSPPFWLGDEKAVRFKYSESWSASNQFKNKMINNYFLLLFLIQNLILFHANNCTEVPLEILTLTLMVVDVSLSNLNLSSAGMTCDIQELVSISIQNIQMFSRLEAELIQYGYSSLSKETSGLSMNCNRNILKTSWITHFCGSVVI